MPSSLSHVSPSSYEDLLECPYRVLLESAGVVRRRPSLRAAVGTIAHELHDRVAKAALDCEDGQPLRSRLETAWDEVAAEVRSTVMSEVAPKGVPPLEGWPGYNLTRRRTILRLEKELRAAARAGPPMPALPPEPLVRTELSLRHDPGRLKGRLDRLERDEHGLLVVDLKTGVRQAAVTDVQRRQLLLYAVLVHANGGEWPYAAAIETAAGVRHEVAVDPSEAEAIAADAQQCLARYNEAIAVDGEPLERLAVPGIEHCRWCPMRIACGPYWERVASDWPYQGAVLGRIDRAEVSKDGWSVGIVAERPRDRLGQMVTALGDWPWPPAVGDMIAIAGATELGSQSLLRINATTTLGRLDAAGALVT